MRAAETRASETRRLRSVSRRADGCEETLRALSCRGIRTSGLVGSQWLGLGWRARVAFSFFEMSQDFPNDLLLGDEGDDAEGASTLTFQRVGLIYPLDELRPPFSEGGAFFWRQLSFLLDVGIFRAAQRLKGEVCFFR